MPKFNGSICKLLAVNHALYTVKSAAEKVKGAEQDHGFEKWLFLPLNKPRLFTGENRKSLFYSYNNNTNVLNAGVSLTGLVLLYNIHVGCVNLK